MADHVLTYRLIVKEIAAKNGVYATFMPKPIFGENGSGMHTHQSLFTDGRNAFFDADDKWHLSDVGKAFIAGQLKHAREIAGVFAQWVNSYKRLVPGYEAPVYVAWSQRNRSALIRIPLYKPGSEQATRAEIRCPDPACNPYLTFACLLHAGLEGIEKGYELPDPMETNLYHLTAEQRRERGIVSLPETLGEAIDELSQSELARKALGKHIFDRYVEIKRKEWDDYRVQLTEVGDGALPGRSLAWVADVRGDGGGLCPSPSTIVSTTRGAKKGVHGGNMVSPCLSATAWQLTKWEIERTWLLLAG